MAKIKQTEHFYQRVRQRTNTPKDVIFRFKAVLKLLAKKKIHPINKKYTSEGQIVFTVMHQGEVFVYGKKNGRYILITYYQIIPKKR